MPINQHRRKTATRADQQAAAAAHRADAGGIYIHQQERGLRGEEEHETVTAWQESGGSYSVKKCNKKNTEPPPAVGEDAGGGGAAASIKAHLRPCARCSRGTSPVCQLIVHALGSVEDENQYLLLSEWNQPNSTRVCPSSDFYNSPLHGGGVSFLILQDVDIVAQQFPLIHYAVWMEKIAPGRDRECVKFGVQRRCRCHDICFSHPSDNSVVEWN